MDTGGGPVRILLLDDPDLALNTSSTLLPISSRRRNTVSMVAFKRLSGHRPDLVSTLFDVDVATGRGTAIAQGSSGTMDWLVDPTGKPLARSDWNVTTQEYSILVKDGSEWRQLYRHNDPEFLRLAGIAPEHDALVAFGDNGTDRSRAWRLPLKGAPPEVLFEDPVADVRAACTDPESGSVVGFVVLGASPGIRWIDPAYEKTQRALDKAFPGQRSMLMDQSADGRKLLVSVESRQDPAVVYLVDLDAHRADIVGETYPALKGAVLGHVRALTYTARDGADIPAFLTLPPGRDDKNLPLVVLVHDAPAPDPLALFDPWAQFLATRGYAVLQPQYRGTAGYGRAFVLAGNRQWGALIQDDVLDGARRLVSDGIADPKRICIMGLGFGGYSALAGVALTPDAYACAVSINGLSDLPKYIEDSVSRASRRDLALDFFERTMGSARDPGLAQRSPARIASSIRSPILLLHGSRDTIMPPGQSELMAKALKANGKQFEFVTLPDGDHSLSNGATRTEVLERIEAFLASHL